MPSTLLRWWLDDVAPLAGHATSAPHHQRPGNARAASQPGSLNRTSDPAGGRLASPPRPVMTGMNRASTGEAPQ
jgi:hypothetical protein